MSTQTVQFRAESGLSLSVKLFAIGSDTVIATEDATEATNRKGTYAVDFADNADGVYEIVALIDINAFASYEVRLVDADGTYYAYDSQDPNVASSLTTINNNVTSIAVDVDNIDGNVVGPVSGFSHTDIATNTNDSTPISGLLVEVFLANTTTPVVTTTYTDTLGSYTVYASSEGPFDVRLSGTGFQTTLVEDVTFTEN